MLAAVVSDLVETPRPGAVRHEWRFDLNGSAAQWWPLLSDTQRFNQWLGMPEVQFQHVQGRVFGTCKILGLSQAWEELPWAWQRGKGLSSERLYSQGFSLWTRVQYRLEDSADKRCLFTVAFEYRPRHWIGRVVLNLAAKRMHARFGTTLLLATPLSSGDLVLPPARALGEEARVRLAQRLSDAMLAHPELRAVLLSLQDSLDYASSEDLLALRPKSVAMVWGLGWQEAALAMLAAARFKALQPEWRSVCPHCGLDGGEADELTLSKAQGYCPSCNLSYEIGPEQGLELVFRLHPSVAELDRAQYCYAEVAKNPHVHWAQTLWPGQSEDHLAPLEAGAYRIRLKGEPQFSSLQVDGDAPDSSVKLKASGLGRHTRSTPHPLLRLENDRPEASRFLVEDDLSDSAALRLAELEGFEAICLRLRLPFQPLRLPAPAVAA